MEIFIDTSALFAFISEDDRNHEIARQTWESLLTGEDKLLTNSYILVESITPILQVDWLGNEQHSRAIEQLLIANRRQLSLVDCSSSDRMRRLGIETVFNFDEHFHEQGFKVIP